MREVKYLSPTSIKQFHENREEFYLQRLAENRPPKLPQTRPMSIGSAFDAHVKSYLSQVIFGSEGFRFEDLFEQQVEEQNRDWARVHGEYAFRCYKDSGALASLITELQRASSVKFEFEVTGLVAHEATIEEIPLLGKPDCHFVTAEGRHIILDWKVNGYCGTYNTSPKKEYILCRDGWIGKQTSSHLTQHKDALITSVEGILVNTNSSFESIDEDWANQLAIYAWVLGAPVGSQFIIGIEQLACAPGQPNPKIRIASHKSFISAEYQKKLHDKIALIWSILQSGHIFTDLTREESDERCKMLDQQYRAFESSDDPREAWFQQITRG